MYLFACEKGFSGLEIISVSAIPIQSLKRVYNSYSCISVIQHVFVFVF